MLLDRCSTYECVGVAISVIVCVCERERKKEREKRSKKMELLTPLKRDSAVCGWLACNTVWSNIYFGCVNVSLRRQCLHYCTGTDVTQLAAKHTHTHNTHKQALLFPSVRDDQEARGYAATRAQGLRKDTGKSDWKQTQVYGKPALILDLFNTLDNMPLHTACRRVRGYVSMRVCRSVGRLELIGLHALLHV